MKHELSYDAWGRLRNPVTQVAYAPGSEPALFLGRGYTGHEYLPWFGLMNMNARLYDPVPGRFLSPDPYVQMPDFAQNLNRYSYALNNPLVYVDPNGEFLHIIVGAIIGGAVNLTVKIVQGKVDNLWDGVVAFGIGAGGRALTAATGGAALAATGLSATSVLGGAITGVTGFATGGVVQNVGNHVYFGDPLMSGKDFALDLATSAIGSGVIGGVSNKIWGKGTNFWTGRLNRPAVSVGNPAQTQVQGPDGKALKSSTLDSKPNPNSSDYASSSQGGDDVIEGIYEFKAASGKTYVGQSQNIPARLQQHIESGKLLPNTAVNTTEVLGGKTAREIAEQLRINTLGRS